MLEDNNDKRNKRDEVAVIAKIDIDQTAMPVEELNGEMPILPLRNMIIFPEIVMPVAIGRRSTLELVKTAYKKKTAIILATQKDAAVDSPELDDLYPLGVVGRIVRIIELPGGTTNALIHTAGPKVRLERIISNEPFLSGTAEPIAENNKAPKNNEFKAIMSTCFDVMKKLHESMDELGPDFLMALRDMEGDAVRINFICSNFPLEVSSKYELLKHDNIKDRAIHLIGYLNEQLEIAKLKQNIQMRTREELDKQQREYFLQQQLKNIQDELGNGTENEIDNLRAQGKKKLWSKEVADIFEKEVTKLERINPQSPDYNVQYTYLQNLLSLPWNVFTTQAFNLKTAEKTLDHDHYGLEKVKERILEHLAVLKLKGDMKSPILCLYGPPGVGKTSLGRSIASALKRKYVRMSLGGVHDEAEIRGHRKTYIGAMPGRIIKSLIKAGSSNPVIILDEIDKLGTSNQGDPASAMLEVLDPEQNGTFHDNYIDIDYDLSNVMFIATANNLGGIPAPLLDRMEMIEVSGYITEEKIEIAKRHLIPKALEANGLTKDNIKLSKAAIEFIVENYTRESGVRELEKKINKVMRRTAYNIALGKETTAKELKPEDIPSCLGPVEYSRDKYQGNEYAGVVTGLAWTAVGGEILFVETSLSRGKGSRLTLTGNLGDVMKESAMLALEYLKAHNDILDIPEEVFENWNIHIHVPEGAIPKDGPSAGITMVTSLASALTRRKVKNRLAMTGEITLRGKVLPVGGIKEKILAAKRAGIQEIILCEENKKDIDNIPEIYLKGLKFHYVSDIREVLDIALTDEIVTNAPKLTIPETKKENDDK
ncbi:endopeptidase La [Bacteroides caecigallinarum]|uniref:endopeptidase La n=1 Tax=Bacteroides caecigallinarum TaxID=1411144 RepID=UPI00195C476E|nr:endopeptidase La [Bacteroides caecigallinarum]MBM6881694.1 endopeptidase La [Bacteroides caecigallinarum]MBM6889936.1 endopeptidase La [Bacteroides caecigallinarum]